MASRANKSVVLTRPEPNIQIAARLAKTPLSQRQISSCERVRRFLPAIFSVRQPLKTPPSWSQNSPFRCLSEADIRVGPEPAGATARCMMTALCSAAAEARGRLISGVTLPERGWGRHPCPSLAPPRTPRRQSPGRERSAAPWLSPASTQSQPLPRVLPGLRSLASEQCVRDQAGAISGEAGGEHCPSFFSGWSCCSCAGRWTGVS
jgi:hypothetical protein